MPVKKRGSLIVNPLASRGGGRGLEPALTAAARSLGWEVEVRYTTRAGHEVQLAREALKRGWPLVVAVGGDGTAHGVANAVLRARMPDAVLGHVPIGTGNDFAKILGIAPGNVARNLERILTVGHVRRLDVGEVADEYFINSMGIGFGADVVRQTLRMTRLKGFLLYLAAVYKTFWSFDPADLEVTSAEFTERERMMMLEILIGTSAGGGFRLTPDALPDDGLFDVCVIREVSVAQFLRYVPRVIRGTHATLPQVSIFQTADLRVTSMDRPLEMHLDGELRLPQESSVHIRIIPRALPVLCVS